MQMLLASIQLGGSGATMPPPRQIARHVIDAFVASDHERAAALQLQSRCPVEMDAPRPRLQ
jgi:4-hydroxy-tetrahydrodipicolinate synthase